jgi:septal ring factor EnvC (AmiA/AmiB activator)
MMQKPLQRHAMEDSDSYEESITTKPKSKEVPQNYAMRSYMTKKAEPVFIRIDKFEESMKIFQDIKSQISEIEELIKNTKETKNKEEEELASWETEIQTIKNQIEKVNQDIFSRIE